MVSIIWYVRHGLRPLWNERGAETAEWMIIVGLLTAIALVIYALPGSPLEAALRAMVTAVSAAVLAAI